METEISFQILALQSRDNFAAILRIYVDVSFHIYYAMSLFRHEMIIESFVLGINHVIFFK